MTEEEYNNKRKEADAWRGNILSRFAILEMGMQEFIIHTYLGKINHNVLVDIFQDTNFGFTLLINIFLKAIKKQSDLKTEFDKGRFESVLRELYRMRNIAAHGIPGVNNADSEQRKLSQVSEIIIKHGHIRTGYNDQTVKSLYDSFMVEYKKIESFIEKLPGVSNKKINFE
jgi:hypothetical protein